MIKIERVAELLSQATHLPYTQCLITVQRRARYYGYRHELPREVARHIVAGELRAAKVTVQPHESLMLV